MSFLFLFSIFVLGTFVGSFLNVVILRYKTGLSIITGHSQCFSCGKQLQWFELIPIISFLFLKGRCAKCGSLISFQYPLIELLSGLLFVLIFSKTFLWSFLSPVTIYYSPFALLSFFTYLTIFSTLLVIAVYDLRHKIIPDLLVTIFVLLSFIIALLNFSHNSSLLTLPSILNLSAGLILFIPFFCLWFFSDGRWIGLGDGKLAIGIGTLLGLAEGLSAIVLGFWLGTAVALLMLFLQKVIPNNGLWKGNERLTMKSELPFAPFLILGTIIVFFYPIDILSLHLFGL